MISYLRQKQTICLIALFGVCLAVSGCANQTPKPGSSLTQGQNGGPVTPGTTRDFSVNVGNTVYFTVNSTELSQEAQVTLRSQAGWLNKYPEFTITIEGHADERGTREYNIALGARRATAARNYLISVGVASARTRTISYGKERPVALCNDISCWSQNRRSVTAVNRRTSS